MVTVLRHNLAAQEFFLNKLKYMIIHHLSLSLYVSVCVRLVAVCLSHL